MKLSHSILLSLSFLPVYIQKMSIPTSETLSVMFNSARSFKGFVPSPPVEKDVLVSLYDTFKWAPTSFNCCPMRIVLATSDDAKTRLTNALSETNQSKMKDASVIAVLAIDQEFTANLDKLSPWAVGYCATIPDKVPEIASTNSWLQAGYFITAARAHGFDLCPMAGFDGAKVTAEFFPEKNWKPFMVIGMGRGDPAKVPPRAHRLAYEEVMFEV